MHMPSIPMLCLALLSLGSALTAGLANATPSVATTPTPEASDSLMLTVLLDAHGVRILKTTAKLGLAFRLPAEHDKLPLQWTIRDRVGSAIAHGGCDPGPICLDLAHHGQPGHARGDIAIPHELATNLKVPLMAGIDTIEFHWNQGTPRAMGSFNRIELGLR